MTLVFLQANIPTSPVYAVRYLTHTCHQHPLSNNPQSFFGAMGCASAIVFTVIGASYGTAKSSGAIFSCGVLRPERLMQNTYAPLRFLSSHVCLFLTTLTISILKDEQAC